ncbi:hypothetical protein DWB68_00535 [Galactobacter valiniphilus]|uniref:Uncharacterized protein n=1 Tax=Galactobacter valiniphilus TaxID=2676122 RepID=A0A399JEV7_9MICC|nr:hypothetical protein [Galactobacter valiniphilus]RII43754.1 hypothetical protein DWB68_00535 [Galactobacter valiniphilus]
MEALDQIVEIHFPLRLDEDTDWIEDVEELLFEAEGTVAPLMYDDGEELRGADGEPEYVFFISNNPLAELIAYGRTLLTLEGVPAGGHLSVNDEEGELGRGERIQ